MMAVKVTVPAAPTPCKTLPPSKTAILFESAAMTAPVRNNVRAIRSIGLLLNTLESEEKMGWKTVEASRNDVARLKVMAVSASRD